MHELPIAQHRQALVDAVAEFPYLVVVGDTGKRYWLAGWLDLREH